MTPLPPHPQPQFTPSTTLWLLPLPAYGNPLSKVISGHKSKESPLLDLAAFDMGDYLLSSNTPTHGQNGVLYSSTQIFGLATFLTSVNGATLYAQFLKPETRKLYLILSLHPIRPKVHSDRRISSLLPPCSLGMVQ